MKWKHNTLKYSQNNSRNSLRLETWIIICYNRLLRSSDFKIVVIFFEIKKYDNFRVIVLFVLEQIKKEETLRQFFFLFEWVSLKFVIVIDRISVTLFNDFTHLVTI